MNAKFKKFEAYNIVSERLPKLCPRLVPSPLWGLSLPKLARMESRIASIISDDSPALVEEISRYWMSLDRSGTCEVCGAKGSEIDEDWLYFVFDDEGKPIQVTTIKLKDVMGGTLKNFTGMAHLWSLRLLCPNCHLAKHQGHALTRGREREALEWLQKINGLNSLDEAKQLVDQAFNIYYRLKQIRKWDIRVGRLKGLDKETRKNIQKLLNHMYGSGFSLDGGWLYHSSPSEHKAIQLAEQEANAILNEVKKKAGEGHYKDEVWVRCLEEIVKDKLEAEGINVSEEGLILLVRLLLDRFKNAGLFEELFIWESVGKWIAMVPTPLYEKIFRKTLKSLEKSGLVYRAKILCEKGKINDAYLPIIVYAPTSFAPGYISSVAKVLKTVLNSFGLMGEIYFKPDVFTYTGIYSEKGRRASIYSYPY
jgi:5-methylcytosine-specific restriction endonuclease McrA